ncbi:HypC/HybG/HupF family hydrogenase formation chaperone [Leptothrix discophora]|uniref:HypC/HybG/HupF family hydrogenase formation chaperone n=1 Tax=Leptothrix discophora TaxID=89 RepID=A0ABT9G1E4_LEPDI|nr:HypC/HybG/HupF family hydrogenase formation chaperone [Leptothrix discophora]MDP4300282.1 HypC/HybG/HupF family hydrogenase formation chaperone [Leptothrix discophora]
MCIGLPLQVLATRPGLAQVAGSGARATPREVGTLLIDPPKPGDWLLVFLDQAREAISAERAAEVGALLDQLDALMQGRSTDGWADFEMPSTLDTHALAALTGQSPA